MPLAELALCSDVGESRVLIDGPQKVPSTSDLAVLKTREVPELAALRKLGMWQRDILRRE